MPYVSCRYTPPDETGMGAETKEGENARIICTDDQGVEWHLTEDSQVGDWLRFQEEDGEVLAYEEQPEPEVDDPDTRSLPPYEPADHPDRELPAD